MSQNTNNNDCTETLNVLVSEIPWGTLNINLTYTSTASKNDRAVTSNVPVDAGRVRQLVNDKDNIAAHAHLLMDDQSHYILQVKFRKKSVWARI